jgi:hypothetical protein
MEQFWKWMKKKGYICKEDLPWWCNCHINENYKIAFKDYLEVHEYNTSVTKQMLIGYMIEYIHETNGSFLGIPSYSNKKSTIIDYYNILEKEINKMQKKFDTQE